MVLITDIFFRTNISVNQFNLRMRILITNDDGPLNDGYSPYIRPFVQYIKKFKPDWDITICVPATQKSWIGKAHLAGRKLSAQFLYSDVSSEDNSYLGPFNKPQYLVEDSKLPNESKTKLPKNLIEWILLDGTPASCVNVGLYHLSKQKFDLVISGPNVGRNTSAAYSTSSGTIGAAMESVICSNTKSLALSWAYYDGKQIVDGSVMEMASNRSVEVISHILDNWHPDYDLYSINVPLTDELTTKTKARYAPFWENRWAGMYKGPISKDIESIDIVDGSRSEAITFNWAPDFTSHYPSKHSNDDAIYDSHVINNKEICVTPMKAVLFSAGLDSKLYGKELEFAKKSSYAENVKDSLVVISIPKKEYIHEPLTNSIRRVLKGTKITETLPEINSDDKLKVFHYGDYEQLDMDSLMSKPNHYFTNSYIYRKALIRKHYLADTIKNFVAKNPNSILKQAFLESFTLDLDYAEFLDDSLDENWELRQELEDPDSEKWWIVKPSMSDKGQGIRVFKTIEDLQEIFNSFDDEEDDDNDDDNKIIISHLRHFIVQEYLKNPLLLPSMDNRKFHIRCYITCRGNLEVFVYDRMLALFAPTPFQNLNKSEYNAVDTKELQCHLTNTCLQKDTTKGLSVKEFANLEDISEANKQRIIQQIHEIAHAVFLAAATVNRINFQPLPNAFETYGVDFLVDSNYDVKILEINAYPDFKQTGDDLKDMIDQLFDNVTQFCILPFFNHNEMRQLPSKKNAFTKVLEHTSNSW